MKKTEKEYVPFCDEWVAEIKKLSKDALVQMLKKALQEKIKLQEKTALPDIYAGELNLLRIKTYTLLNQQFDVSHSTMREIFCAGADFYKQQIK